MTYTYKISVRLALCYAALVLAATGGTMTSAARPAWPSAEAST